MVDTSGLQKKLQDSEAKSKKFEAKKRASFRGARFFGLIGAFALAADVGFLQFHDEEAYLQVKADYQAGQLVIPDDYISEKAINCIEDVYEDEFEEEAGIDFDDLDRELLLDIIENNSADFAKCTFNALSQSDEVQKDYVDEQDFHWNTLSQIWGLWACGYAAFGLNSWRRERKYDAIAKNKTLDLKLLE
jgi:hypothetical protein